MSRKPTINTGAVIQRDAIRRWARRQLDDPRYARCALALIDWLEKQKARTKRPGGLGSRGKKQV